jgi:formiminoglutamase
MKLPLLISVPHAGLDVPEEVRQLNLLTKEQIMADGDEGAQEIYNIYEHVRAFVTTPIARAFVDMNRPMDDRGRDGIVKTHTIWDEPIYSDILPETVATGLIERYYKPYHRELTERAPNVILGLDCHTMAAIGPAIGPMAGEERPFICLSNADGACPGDWFEGMANYLSKSFGIEVSMNHPFKGGYITRHHSAELPWMQLELSRAPFLTLSEKRKELMQALSAWCKQFGNHV